MMTLTNIFLLIMSLTSIILNPMKMCMVMAFSSLILMLNIYYYTGKTWMVISMYMLFMGGILLMFMILSSIMPNEKMKKTFKKSKKWMFILILFPISYSISIQKEVNYQQMQQIKFFISNSMNMLIITSIIILYFSMFVFMVKKNKNSMRTI